MNSFQKMQSAKAKPSAIHCSKQMNVFTVKGTNKVSKPKIPPSSCHFLGQLLLDSTNNEHVNFPIIIRPLFKLADKLYRKRHDLALKNTVSVVCSCSVMLFFLVLFVILYIVFLQK